MIQTAFTLEQKQRAFEELKAIKQFAADRGWFPATSGNLSVKLPPSPFSATQDERFHFAVTASGKDKSMHTPEDYLIVDENGRPAEATGLKPSAETLIHCEIYKHTNAGAVLHVHTVFNNLISEMYAEQGYVPVERVELIKAFNIWEEDSRIDIPVLPNYADIPSIARLVERALVPRIPGILLRNHGIYAWGANMFESKRHLEAFEFLFEYVYRWHLLAARK